MNDLKTPELDFPSAFLSGNEPDVDMPSPTYIQTSIEVSNDMGTSVATSNKLYPETSSIRILGPRSLEYNAEEFSNFVQNVDPSKAEAAEKQIEAYTIKET